MIDPMNIHPIDPAWIAKVEAAATAAAANCECMVLVMAIQNNDLGKCMVTVEGVPESGALAEMAKDPIHMLISMAQAAHMQEQLHNQERTKHKDH